VNTFGFLAGELIRRVTGMTPGTLLRRQIAGPLGADVHIGLPSAEHGRVAEFAWPLPPADPGWAEVSAEMPAEISEIRLMTHHAYLNPPGLSGAGVVNTAAWRTAEIPSANAHATAAGVARIYAALAGGTSTGTTHQPRTGSSRSDIAGRTSPSGPARSLARSWPC
jgi:CubicO group peptidase (beta-lactamase class C family)